MPQLVYDLPGTRLALYVAAGSVLVMLLGILLVKPILRVLVGRAPDVNEAISYSTSGFSLFYGLLLGLLTVAAYQNRESVEASIQNEASAIAALYGDMNSYPEPIRSDMRDLIRDYVQFTIHRDWPAMRAGAALEGGSNRADAMRQRLATFEPDSASQEIVHREVVSAFQDFSGFRQARLNGVETRIPDVLWYAVLAGAVINVLLLLMLRMRQIPHFLLGTINTFFLGVILFVIVSLDDPLRGERGLGPGPFEQSWERQMNWDEPRS
jgi:AcrR family transcriptional regulator